MFKRVEIFQSRFYQIICCTWVGLQGGFDVVCLECNTFKRVEKFTTRDLTHTGIYGVLFWTVAKYFVCKGESY